MNPVMKQYAARGSVDRWGSTSPIRWDFEKTVAGETHKRESVARESSEPCLPVEETGGGRRLESEEEVMV